MKKTVARIGHRMIEVRIKFWTDEIAAGGNGHIIPKHAWDSGVVLITANPDHGIKSDTNPEIFHSLLDLPLVVLKVLIDHGVTLHVNRKLRKLNEPVSGCKAATNDARIAGEPMHSANNESPPQRLCQAEGRWSKPS